MVIFTSTKTLVKPNLYVTLDYTHTFIRKIIGAVHVCVLVYSIVSILGHFCSVKRTVLQASTSLVFKHSHLGVSCFQKRHLISHMNLFPALSCIEFPVLCHISYYNKVCLKNLFLTKIKKAI